MPAKIVYWAAYGLARSQITEAFEGLDGIDFHICSNLDELLPAMDGARGLIVYDAPEDIAGRVIAKLNQPSNTVEKLHFVSAGRDGFERAGLPRHIEVSGPGSATGPAVAEHALALTLASLRAIPQAQSQARAEIWSRHGVVPHMASLEDRTVAVIGYGAIGKAVSRLLRAFGASVTAVTRSPPAPGEDDDLTVVSLDAIRDVVAESDIVIVTIALAPETIGMFDAELLGAIRPGSYFVNVARGELVDMEALEALLRSGRLAGAALDVVWPEPLPEGHSLWTAPNLIITPHVAAAGSLAGARRLAAAARRHMVPLATQETGRS
ncbi:D-2-hydroxyacid dehydrogenase [Sphingomonas sp. C8-2]|nr:D-2-hydroxyacid dehydrogenase [Sphingomonas sp. C8-2]